MKTHLFIFIIFLHLPFLSSAQDFHYLGLKLNNSTFGIEVGIFNPSNCEDNLLYDTDFGYYTDITFDADGQLYGFNPNGFSGYSIQEFNYTTTFWGYVYENILDNVTGMTCTPLGDVYLAGEGLTAWQENGLIQDNYLGDFPPSMQSEGDLTFRNGKLYMSSVSNSLVEVNIDNPANSVVAFDFPSGTPPIHGLATIEIECDSFVTYASGITSTGSIIYLVDFDNETLVEVCQSDRFIIGFASMDECLVPQCDVVIDLDSDDSSGASSSNFISENICVPPVNISDDDVSIYSEIDHVDSIQINIYNSFYVGDYLEIQNFNNINIFGNGSTSLTLVNEGNANISDFEDAISNIVYHNNSSNIFPSSIDIEVVAFSIGVVSNLAYSTILLGESNVTIEIEENNLSCFGGNDGQLIVIPNGGVEPYDYLWSNNQTLDTIDNLPFDIYQITVTDKYGCSAIENNIVLSQPDSLEVEITNIGALTICNTGGQLLATGNGGTNSYDFSWSNGVATNSNNGINPGTYSVTLTDINGCESIDSITLENGFPVFSNESISLCEGEVFEINNQTFLTDTIVCEIFTLTNGCDSTHCYEVNFTEIITSNFVEKICPGDSFLWNGEMLDIDTIVVDTFNSFNGCDSIVSLNLELYILTPINFATSGSLCDGGEVEISTNSFNTFLWSTGETIPSIKIGEENIYAVTVTDDNNCEIQNEILIEIPDIEINYQVVQPSCYGVSDGNIQIENVFGGTEPYTFSLNGEPFQQSFSFGNLGGGTYNLIAEDINGCQKQIEITIIQPVEPTLEIQNYYEINLGDSLELQLITNISNPSISWQPSTYLNCDTCLNVIANPFQSVFYEIIASDINGCMIKNTVEIEVDQKLDVFIPNAFSPNDDGFNDLFSIYGGSSISNINYLKVFDRWGELVYERENFLPNNTGIGWDGRFKNKKMLDGVYIYIVEVERIDGSKHSLSGEVTLVR